MLAPRKKLWSTPLSAVDHCLQFLPLKQNDCVLDIGCGDGRILLAWAERISSNNKAINFDLSTLLFRGIDIDADRIKECQVAVQDARDAGRIAPELKMEFVCANALESVELFQEANTFFLYLIPRGLKQIAPLLIQHAQRLQQTIRVATYMSKLPSTSTVTQDGTCTIRPLGRAFCHADHQREAAWPLYFYEIQPSSIEDHEQEEKSQLVDSQ
jgi:ubiquinone/menaquinone biosynthesis C-methylase UbiE